RSIRAVEQKGLQQLGIAGDEARTQTGDARALREAVEDDATLEGGVPRADCGLQQPRRRMRLVQIDLAVAFVGSNDEVVSIGELDRVAQVLQARDGTRRIVRRAQEEQLATAPDVLGHAIQVRQESILFVELEEIG